MKNEECELNTYRKRNLTTKRNLDQTYTDQVMSDNNMYKNQSLTKNISYSNTSLHVVMIKHLPLSYDFDLGRTHQVGHPDAFKEEIYLRPI